MRLIRSSVAQWKCCALASMAIVLLALGPQIHLWLTRGHQWHGAYATIQGDEFLYSAYMNTLIDGRPRRNDPFTGQDNTPKSPLPETAFSIQFIPPFVIAWFARACGISSSGAFIALTGIGGLLASLSVLWLLAPIIGDRRLTAVGMLIVLCFGALAGGQGLVGLLLRSDVMFLGLPFLRRYQPAAVFPLFFVVCALVWRALTTENRWRARIDSTLAGLTLSILVFSYLYLWTAAGAWLICLALLWLFFRPSQRWRSLELFTTTGAITILALIPYARVVSHRATSLDEAQTLTFTHLPDLLRIPEIIGAVIVVVLLIGLRRGKIKQTEPRVIFAASFVLLPFVLFNQQVLTGRSMQPYHFENFVANYAVLIALVIVVVLRRQPITRRSLGWVVALCFLWGAIEVSLAAVANFRSNVVADQMVPVLLRLKELSRQDGTLESLRHDGRTSNVVFSPHREVMGLLPTWTSQGTLLGMGGLDFGGASRAQRKEFLYMYLYYSGADAGRMQELLSKRTEDFFMSHYARIAVFGHERVVPMLSSDFKPIRQEEIETEVNLYQSYLDSFSREKALVRPLTYVVTRADSAEDFSHIDRWYQRDNGEKIGDYNLYRVKLRE